MVEISYVSDLPALYLYPLNGSFAPKCISLADRVHIVIGRHTNIKTVPTRENGRFSSKVLSRMHAEVWAEGGKIFARDTQSSNGTYLNGTRLSPEGKASPHAELHTGDEVVLGIDVFGRDNVTICHHKVAARVVCAFTEQDAHAAELPPSVRNGLLGDIDGAGLRAAL
ncbi:uncharacterized protein PHACADRAFT_253284 [Phanerochaete carnosa HHB-10118-sp]|uniref:FHA domain-containing protein n=1 Tax=Phanerochaete carnosa (strain HHB-10118-sp) TaxID=650164 RepID=K5WB92_PHACS|nr:uncharacterized protein PHACADRAFT_253284 [Phanerochaete carnosa HHB-10118-sp]EKM56254.1 hypothetical protein PHACADRAFT_253284 [Phanerochaete carnosa HHB-10118-sp]